jgi:hypothetical protein
MTRLEAIKKIQESNASENVKNCLCHLASEFDIFLRLAEKHPDKGLMNACYKEFGLKFLGMYGIKSLDDVIRKAEKNSLLA